MKKISFILIFASLLFCKNSFLREGNLSIATNAGDRIISVIKTQVAKKYIALLDEDNDDIIGSDDLLVLIDTNSTSRYIEFHPITVTGLPTYSNYVINKIYKRPDPLSTQYFIIGKYDNPTVPNTFGFALSFNYVPTVAPALPNTAITILNDVSFSDYNVSDITDIFEVGDTGSFILSGSIYDNIGANDYLNANATITTVNAKQKLAWVAEVNTALAIKRHYINKFTLDETDEHLLIDATLNKDGNITAIGRAGTDNRLFAFELNYTEVDTATPALELISNYTPYSLGVNNIADATILIPNGANKNFPGKYGDPFGNMTVQYPRPNATEPAQAPFSIPGIVGTFPYTLNATANITFGYDGYKIGIDELWNFLDINCSDTTGISRDLDTVYVISFPYDKIEADSPNGNCQSPNVKYYVSSKNIAQVKLQWEFISEKNSLLKWDRFYQNDGLNKMDTKTTSRIINNTNYKSADNNLSTLTILHNTLTLKNQFNLIKINGNNGNVESDNYHPKNPKASSIVRGRALINDQDGNMIIVGGSEEKNTTSLPKTDCLVIKVDKNGNEIWEQYLGNFHDDYCSDIVIETENKKPGYHEYLAVGRTLSTSANLSTHAWALTFRDSGTLIDLNYQWNLIGNPTDRNITGVGSIDGVNNIAISDLGSHKYYFLFKDNQWQVNRVLIEPLDGFFLVSYDNKQKIFLEGNLLEQDFQEIQDGETGWVLLSTGVKIINPKIVYGLHSLYIYRNNQYQSSPIEIYPGEGFWAKKRR